MELRAMTSDDLREFDEIDGTIEATHYLHVERTGQGMALTWKIEERALRQKTNEPGRLSDDLQFVAKQIAAGAEEGVAMVAEHDGAIVGAMIAQMRPDNGTMLLRDLRVDFDYRRQGVGLAMMYQLIQRARDLGVRAVSAETKTNNIVAGKLLAKCGFDLAGVDTHRETNHDLVKEA